MIITGPPQPASDPNLKPVTTSAMPPALLAAIYPYERLTRDKIHMAWARMCEADRLEYIEFVGRRFAWPGRRRRSRIAAEWLAELDET